MSTGTCKLPLVVARVGAALMLDQHLLLLQKPPLDQYLVARLTSSARIIGTNWRVKAKSWLVSHADAS